MSKFSVGDTVTFKKQVSAQGIVVALEGKVATIRESDGSEHRVVANFVKRT